MRIKWDATWIADDDYPPFDIKVDGKQIIEEQDFLRATSAEFQARGNRTRSLEFTVDRNFSTTKDAEKHLLNHYETLADSAELTVRCGLPSEVQEDVIISGAVLEAVIHPRYLGVATWTTFRFRFPRITDIVTTPPDDIFTSGTAAIGSGVDALTVSGLGLAWVPAMILCSIRKPASGYNLVPSVVDASVTADGFTVNWQGLTDSTAYKLDWVAIQ